MISKKWYWNRHNYPKTDFLTPPLTKSFNFSIEHNIYSDLAKATEVVPRDKGKPNKNDISNFRPVGILNTFSEIFEGVVKNQLLHGECFLVTNFCILKNYNLQHVLLRLIETWRKYLDKDFVTQRKDAALTDLSKSFNCAPRDLLIAKLETYGVGEKALSYIYSYVTNRNQCVLVNDKKSNFQKITSGGPHSSIAGPILFNFLISYMPFFVSSVSVFTFADDNSLPVIAKTLYSLSRKLLSIGSTTIT